MGDFLSSLRYECFELPPLRSILFSKGQIINGQGKVTNWPWDTIPVNHNLQETVESDEDKPGKTGYIPFY